MGRAGAVRKPLRTGRATEGAIPLQVIDSKLGEAGGVELSIALLLIGWKSSRGQTEATSENGQPFARFDPAPFAKQAAEVPRTGSYRKRGTDSTPLSPAKRAVVRFRRLLE